jgi:hypothetical protein
VVRVFNSCAYRDKKVVGVLCAFSCTARRDHPPVIAVVMLALFSVMTTVALHERRAGGRAGTYTDR